MKRFLNISWNRPTHTPWQERLVEAGGGWWRSNSHLDFDLICICTEEFEFLDLMEFGGVLQFPANATPKIHRIEKLKHLSTDSNSNKSLFECLCLNVSV